MNHLLHNNLSSLLVTVTQQIETVLASRCFQICSPTFEELICPLVVWGVEYDFSSSSKRGLECVKQLILISLLELQVKWGRMSTVCLHSSPDVRGRMLASAVKQADWERFVGLQASERSVVDGVE